MHSTFSDNEEIKFNILEILWNQNDWHVASCYCVVYLPSAHPSTQRYLQSQVEEEVPLKINQRSLNLERKTLDDVRVTSMGTSADGLVVVADFFDCFNSLFNRSISIRTCSFL